MILSSYPTVPVKQIVADLVAEDSSRCPAAVFWNNTGREDRLGVDQVHYRPTDLNYYHNAESPRAVEMRKTWLKVFDGEAELGSCRTGKMSEEWTGGTEWLGDIVIWARKHTKGERIVVLALVSKPYMGI